MRKRYVTFLLFILYDVISTFASISVALTACKNTKAFFSDSRLLFTFLIITVSMIVLLYFFRIYNILWKYSNLIQLTRILVCISVSIAVYFISSMAVFSNCFDYIFLMTFFLVEGIFLIGFRIALKKFSNKLTWFDMENNKDSSESGIEGNVMIIGAGSAGEIIMNEIARKKEYARCKVKCFIDDDPLKIGQYISGIKIIGGRNKILTAVEKHNISVIIFAIPNCPGAEKSKILNICQHTNCTIKVVPSVCKMYNVSEITNLVRTVEIEDLLGRETVDAKLNKELNYVNDKVVLVTGGGGSIGSELCRQISEHSPKLLIIFDIYENNAYEIQNELIARHPNLNLVTLIGSVRDSKRLDYLFETYRPEIVYHAAAHKHVPLMEASPNETIKNNVFGTLKTATCADKYGTEKFVLISTDKAVNPTNIMGASKRICEMIVQCFNKKSSTDFVAVRFGNVLGSNGSVIPLFKKQISAGGPVTVTHPDIIRYFMTISEAVSLVLEAGAKALGGEIFVLDMGNPVKILTLAENLIKLSGYVPYKDIDIEFTGLRPGEKLFEELLMSEEGLTATENELIHIGRPIDIDEKTLFKILDEMKASMYDETVDVRLLVKKIVPTYVIENKK